MGNPLISLGSLNRLRGSVTWDTNPQLNITASYLGSEGIKLALEGNATTLLPAMTGLIPSPEPYMAASITIALLKTQGICDLYKQAMETNSVLGGCTVRPDVGDGGIGYYQLIGVAIETIRELSFNGSDAGWNINCKGYYLTNSALWNF